MTVDQEQEPNEMRRKDDTILMKIAVGLSIAMFTQVGFSIYYAGSLANQVSNNTKAIEIIAKRMEMQDATATSLARVEVMIESLTSNLNRIADKVEGVTVEQQRRTPVIDRADRYLRKHGE